jgi:hypothetical protein
LSATHCLSWHTLPTQLVEQQSVFELHDVPPDAHLDPLVSVQLPVESHIFEQQVSPVEHGVPNTPHGLLASGGLPLPFLPPHATTRTAKHSANQALWIMAYLP